MSTNKYKVIIGGLVVLGAVIYFTQTLIEKKEQDGRSALYKIQKTYEDELKAIPEADRAAGVLLDVDAKFAKTTSELKAMLAAKAVTDHTLFEAGFKLGNLYIEHNQFKLAQDVFSQTLKFASGAFQKASCFYLLGVSQERNSQNKEANESYQQGMTQGFDGLKAEFLFGLVRTHVKLNQKDKAKANADKLSTEFAGTHAATEAQALLK